MERAIGDLLRTHCPPETPSESDRRDRRRRGRLGKSTNPATLTECAESASLPQMTEDILLDKLRAEREGIRNRA
jgi:hypothetical protein